MVVLLTRVEHMMLCKILPLCGRKLVGDLPLGSTIEKPFFLAEVL